MRDRRRYLLVEVLIALMLVALCAVPLLHPHGVMLKREMDNLRKVQRQRVADLAFAEVKQRLYRGSLTVEALQEGTVILLDPMLVEVWPGKMEHWYPTAEVVFENKVEARGCEGYLLKVVTTPPPAQNGVYRLLVRKKGRVEEEVDDA